MKEEIINLYEQFDKKELPLFFTRLVKFTQKYDKNFKIYVYEDSLNAIQKFKAEDFYLGTTDDNLEGLAESFVLKLVNLSDQEICRNVVQMIWDVVTYTTEEVCPSCQEANLKIASSPDRSKVYKTCDNCLITIKDNNFIERPMEMIPAIKEQISKLGK